MADEDKKKAETEKDPKTLAAVEAGAKTEPKAAAEGEKKEGTETKTAEEEKKPEAEGDKKSAEGEAKTEGEGEKKTDEAPAAETEKKEGDGSGEGEEKEAKTEGEGEDKPKKKRFGFGFGKKKQEDEDGKAEAEKPAEAKGEMAQLIKEFELAQEVNDKIEAKADFFVVKVKKSVVMLLLGLLVIAMWAVPVTRGIKLYLSQKGISITLPFLNKGDDSPEASGSGELQAEGPKIRIRDSSETDDGAQKLATLLEEAGFNAVEVQTDTENEYDGLGLIVKPGEDELRQQIVAALGSEYKIGSPSAELTADSDFDAVILFGKSSNVKGETDTSGGEVTASPEATSSADVVSE